MHKLHKLDLYGRCVKRKPLLFRKNIRARLKFAHEHLGKDQDFWNNLDRRDKDSYLATVPENMFSENLMYHQKNLIPTVKHDGGT